jgi:energy-coupling factor transporter ATP-binding protein EcfA2
MAGERGINLSGGQRQRVCLARAAYHNAQLVLLDNPLSAVDQHTSKHIFDKCIKGLLLEKAVVLVAHQLELLPQVGEHVIIGSGKASPSSWWDLVQLLASTCCGAGDALGILPVCQAESNRRCRSRSKASSWLTEQSAWRPADVLFFAV